MPFDFPNSPTIGQSVTASNGVTYVWDGVKWTVSSGAGGGGGTDVSNSTVLASGSTTSRTLATRFSDEVNVLDYGAVADGTTDCTAAFNAALGTNRNVYVPAGSYKLTNSITVGNATRPQRLRGEGDASVLVVDHDFNATALGIVVVYSMTSLSYVFPNVEIDGIRIFCTQPPDIVTTASVATSAGGSTITVASTTGIRVGNCIYDQTNPTALSTAVVANTPFRLITVSSIAGNVITLSGVVGGSGVSSGDTLSFGMTRATMAPPGTGTTVPGGTGVKYPWAIYAPQMNLLKLNNIFVSGAWNGLYFRGGEPYFGNLVVGAMNIGFDIDGCHNFGHINSLSFYLYGFRDESAANTGQARKQSYYDGTTIAANFGAIDGMTIDTVNAWSGIVNITTNFSWAQFGTMALDGDHSNLVCSTGPHGSNNMLVGSLYRTTGVAQTEPAIVLNGDSGFRLIVANFTAACASTGAPIIQVNSGNIDFSHGRIWTGVQGASPIVLAGTDHRLGNITFDGTTAGGYPYIVHTAGSLRVIGSSFLQPVSGRIGISLTDNVLNVVRSNAMNGWGTSGIPATAPLGQYERWSQLGFTASTATTNDAIIAADALAGYNKIFEFRTAGVRRWRLTTESDAETGGNAGSSFALQAFDDLGNALGLPPVMLVSRPTGAVTFGYGVAITGALTLSADPAAAMQPVTLQYYNAHLPSVPGPATTTSPMNGTAAVGTSLLYARQDHVHPSDTSRAPLASPTFTGTPAAPTATAGTNTTQLATTAFVTTATGAYLPLAGGAITGSLTVGTTFATAGSKFQTDTNGLAYSGSATSAGGYVLNGPTASTRGINFQTAGTQRWVLQADNSAESGSNAGTNFVLTRLDDTGTSLGNPLSINRATGVMTVANGATITAGGISATGGLTVLGGSATIGAAGSQQPIIMNGPTSTNRIIYLQSAGVTNWVFGNNTSTDFMVQRYVSGSAAETSIVVRSASGQVELGSYSGGADTIIGKQSAGAAADTGGFLLIPFLAGAPTGVPTNSAKGAAMRYDTTNHKLWIYDGGWKGVVVA